MSSIQVGDRAPDFTATMQDGKLIRMADFLGKKAVVLYFYPKDNTAACTAQACAFRDAYEQFVEADAEVIGVSSDSSESHRDFAAQQRLPFTLVSDQDRSLRNAFGVPKTLGLLPGRVTYVIDREGIVRHIFNSQFNAERHIAESLEIVKQLRRP
jgi:peroxiredoxin Q/BCP